MKNNGFVPIKKIFRIINSCKNEKQLKTCIKIAKYYTELVKSKGVVNSDLVYEDLLIKINEKRNELHIANKFRGLIRRKRINIKEIEKELAENFH